ncbi:MAG: endonuclease/exonuclease/phosphatase family protein [Myxococcota bacterium]|nr:endonuclease/exonuclease/phosphatase family protein [Myxococcota bacterium]
MCAVILVGLSTLWVVLEPLGWVAALASHWRLHVALAAMGVGLWAAGRRRWSWFFAMMLSGGLLLHPVIPEFRGLNSAPRAKGGETSRPSLKVLSLNVHMTQRHFGGVDELLALEKPDLVMLVEVDQGWIEGLEASLEAYPHRYESPRSDFLGLAIYSRRPLRTPAISHPGGPDGPVMAVGVQVGDVWTRVALVHGLPPIRPDWSHSQRQLFEGLAATISRAPGPYLVCGDFNATPWSSPFKEFRLGADLLHSRGGSLPPGTWPTWVPSAMRIPIDHCLVSREWRVNRYELGDSVGSDHLPVVVELSLQDPNDGS